MSKSLILCDCAGTQAIDAEGLKSASGLPCSKVHSALCTTQSNAAVEAIKAGEAIICCDQESALFEELADSLNAPAPATLDLRDRAGWSLDEASKLPKMAALVAEATLPAATAKTLDVVSEGLCLILARDETALQTAAQLSQYLSVTVLLPDPPEGLENREFDVVVGRMKAAKGSLGQFDVTIDALQIPDPAGRGDLTFSDPQNGGRSQCDILLDLRGETPLFPAHEKREGYLRPDPGNPLAVAAAVLDASHLTGTFEQPLYIKAEPLLCAHSRAEQTGCTRCLDVCPTGAITPDGDHVTIDPLVCAGCGACASLCPSGAITYDAPPADLTFRRIQTLAKAFLDAGGTTPHLLAVNEVGAEMIRLAARYGNGLPANVIALEVEALATIGHAEMLAALAAGFAEVSVLLTPKSDRDVIAKEAALARAMGGNRITLLDTTDPDVLSGQLFEADVAPTTVSPQRPMGTRRQIARTAAKALNPEATLIPLPDAAPYGAVLVDTDACTLCLSCISLCPSGALGDNPDLPQLRFQEDACLQCGLCANVCPEDAITYAPRMNLENSAFEQVVLNEEEPFACVECGDLFGVKSTIEKITEKLAGKHTMFKTSDAARMIQMCDNCRINAQYHAENSPFAGAERPRPRTTADYLSKRKDH